MKDEVTLEGASGGGQENKNKFKWRAAFSIFYRQTKQTRTSYAYSYT